MRVLLVSAHGTDPTYGGAERYVRNLVAGLTQRGHAPEVLSAFPQPEGPAAPRYVLHDSDWREDRTRRLRNHVGDAVSARWRRVREVVRQARPDVVHTNNLPGIGTGVWGIAHDLGIPVVHTLHDYYLLCPRTSLIRRDGTKCEPHPLLCGARTRRLMRWEDAVGTVLSDSEHVLEVHGGMFAGARKRVVRPPLVLPGDGAVAPPRTPPRTLGYLGALAPIKGVELLLEAAPALAREGLVVRIAGDGPLRAAVEAAAHVEYAGRVEGPGLAAFLESCDVGVVPSLWDEPGPLVVGEWLAAGRPVLGTRRGGIAEAIRRELVVPIEESPASLVEAARRLGEAQEWERRLGAIPDRRGDADLQRWLDEHEEAYEAVAAGKVERTR